MTTRRDVADGSLGDPGDCEVENVFEGAVVCEGT